MKSLRLRCSQLVSTVTAATVCGLCGCSPSEFHIKARAHYPDDITLANMEITALPFDPDALRDSLVEASDIPRPQFPDLETELASYRRPDISGLEESFLPWQAIHDSVHHLADSLNNAGSDSSPEYASAYARLRDQYQRLAQSAVHRDAAIREQVGDDRQLAMRVAAAADTLRAWEGLAFAQFSELADSAIAREGRGFHRATTNDDGVAEFTLAPGRWWLMATRADPENPFAEYYWNVGMVVGLFGSRTVPLYAENGVGRWRY